MPPRFLLSATPHRAVRIAEREVRVALQPIIDVTNGRVVAAEALARFPTEFGLNVEQMFALAHESGRGHELEAACLRAALQRRDDLPSGVLLTVNLSPDALLHPAIQAALEIDLDGIVIEVLEHVASDQLRLLEELTCLRRRGALVAVDDTSSGHAGLTRLASLRPDIVKLDRSLVTGVIDSLERTAVIDAIVSLCRRLEARVLGEGVESAADLAALAALDVDFAQGMAIAPPARVLLSPSLEAIATCYQARQDLMSSRPRPEAWLRGDNLGQVTAALAGSVRREDLRCALSTAATRLRVDQLSLSMLGVDRHLREVGGTGEPDERAYAVAEFPATAASLASGMIIEAHVNDPDSDPAERALLAATGRASLLMAPLIAGGAALGVLEFSHSTHRRWTTHEIAQARSLAEHVSLVLLRLAPTSVTELAVAAGL